MSSGALHPAMNAASNLGIGAAQGSILSQMAAAKQRVTTNKRIFVGNIEVQQVANGYVVNIGSREGYEFETHIAATIAEVNAIIATQIVAFRLEDKS